MAPLTSRRRKSLPRKSFAIPGKKKYPIDTVGRARNAITRVRQHGSPTERRRVYRAVKRKYPRLAERSSIIPTRRGPGRRVGQPIKKKGGGRKVATRKQIAAAKRNLRKARAARSRRRRAPAARAGRRRRR